MNDGFRMLVSFTVAFIGGVVFYYAQFPLPWMLGAVTGTLLWKFGAKQRPFVAAPIKNTALIVIGCGFGLQFNMSVIQGIAPYLPLYLLATILLIAASVAIGLVLARLTGLDRSPSVLGLIPGGLAEMIALSESLRANPTTVVFIQTVRLLCVLAIVPAAVTYWFASPVPASGSLAPSISLEGPEPQPWLYMAYVLPAAAGWLGRKMIPASYVLMPLIITAILHNAVMPLPSFQAWMNVWAQLAIGIGIGQSVTLSGLQQMRQHAWRITASVLSLLVVSFALGWGLDLVTDMDTPTAVLSIAPGGLIEMSLTAVSIHADYVTVTSLQFVRVLFIVTVIPIALKVWLIALNRKRQHT